MSDDRERSLAKCSGFDFGVEDHGCPYLFGAFEYDDSGVQGLGYIMDTEFLMKFMAVFDVEKLSRINGKSCWVTHTNSQILKIEPLHKKDGVTFDIEDWLKQKKKSK